MAQLGATFVKWSKLMQDAFPGRPVQFTKANACPARRLASALAPSDGEGAAEEWGGRRRGGGVVGARQGGGGGLRRLAGGFP